MKHASSAEEILLSKKTLTDKPSVSCSVDDAISDDDDDENGGLITKKTSENFPARLGKCEVCSAYEARYTCPKCEVKTCCLDCIKIHKKELECDGIRDRTKFIPIRDMTKMDFMSDYYFLEECTRYVEDRKRDKIKQYTRYNRDLPQHLNRLRNACKERKIILKFLLQNFARHKENTTYYNWKQKKIWWRIKWIFVNAGNLCYTDGKSFEDEMLRDLLRKYLDKDCIENVPEKKNLEYYQSKGVQNVKVLLKAEGIKNCKERYYMLDVNKTLNENLQGKIVVEYPCIYITYEENSEAFDVIDSDDDVEAETKKHEEHLNEYRKLLIDKQKRAANKANNSDCDDDDDDGDEKLASVASSKELETLKRLQAEKRRQERLKKREEYEKAPNNFLFTDEQLLDILSSDTEDEKD